MNADGILKIVRGLKVAMSLADAVPTEAHKHEGELKWFGEVVNVHGGYDAIRDALEAARAALGKRAKREADNIKTWQERMDAGSSLHDQSILTRTDYMAEEIADLRAALRHPPVPNVGEERRRAFAEIGEKLRANIRPDELAKFVDAEILKPRASTGAARTGAPPA